MTAKEFSVLLIEDNPGDAEMTRRGLHHASPDCIVSIARNGTQAMERLRQDYPSQEQPDVILLDINMPGMDGKTFLSLVKADNALKKIPVIMFTSSDAPNDIHDCYERHANSYVVKPFSGRDYTRAMSQIVSFWRDLNAGHAQVSE